jgi:battenin
VSSSPLPPPRSTSSSQHTRTALTSARWERTGLINNVIYVIILSAALDLVGPSIPKGVVLLADVMPSFLTKLIAPYFIHRVPYSVRVVIMTAMSCTGMFIVALSTPYDQGGSVVPKLLGIIMASLSSGGGELSFLGLTHYYGHFSLAAWSSGTGGAGLAGAGLYVLLTTTFGFSVAHSLFASAFLPLIMLVSFFGILPREPLRLAKRKREYQAVGQDDEALLNGDDEDVSNGDLSASLTRSTHSTFTTTSTSTSQTSFLTNLRRAKSLFLPYMLPLLLVYIAEYSINQGVAPTLLFDLDSSPFDAYRDFYPMYGLLYQVGVFIARSSTPFIRIHNLYLPSLLQVGNLALLISQALYFWMPSVYVVFGVIFWEGLLGGAVYVNTFAEILDTVSEDEREFSLGATSVSDSGGVCVAGFIGMALEVGLCSWQVRHGRNWCRMV